MSGHSKWSTIKHKKGATDAKRGKIFTRLNKEITIAARIGGGDPDANPRLRTAIASAKSQNMPKDNIDRAIKKGTGTLEGMSYEEFQYEGYGPNGMAVLVEIMTDNKNRTASEIRFIFSKSGGNLGENGCVAWMFDKKGLIIFNKSDVDEEKIMEIALDAGAEDIDDEAGEIEIITAPSDFENIKKVLEDAGFKPVNAEITMIPQTTVQLTGHQVGQALRLMDALEDNDDVQNVYANFDISDEDMEALN